MKQKSAKEIILEATKGVKLTVPDRPELGDYAFFSVDAEKVVDDLKANKELAKIAEVKAVGKFVNFYLKPDVLLDSLISIDGEYGKNLTGGGKKYMVEFAHPNTHKAFHVGHLRNITTGECVVRLLEAIGTKVVRANYQGDVGLHIAKALYGIQKKGFTDPGEVKARAKYLGEVYALGSQAFEADEEAKKKIIAINKQIYDQSDPKINDLYQTTRAWSLEYFDAIYQRVGSHFDRLYFESEVASLGLQIAQKAESEGVLEKSEGAVIFPGEKYDLHSRVFVTSEGVPTYEAKDLGLAKLQFGEHNPDLIVHVVAPEQAGYFQVLFKALELIQPETKGREFHLQYGWVRLKEGKMSSRLGNVILGEDLLDEAKKRIIEKYKTEAETAEKIAVGAIKYSFLKTGISQEIAFDMDESISLDGNSGPYLQYTAARAMSVLRKAEITNYKLQITNLNEEERALLRHLVHYPEMVEEAAARFAPNLLCEYLYQLASKFNTFYNIHRILNSNKHRILESEKSRGDLMKLDVNFRLSLTSAVAQVLSSGLSLLGIEAPERM